jgi:hypothetical protein
LIDQANRSTILPLRPLLDNSVSAVLPVCRASAEFSRKLAVELPAVVVDEFDVLVDEFDALEDEPADAFEDVEELPVPEELDVGDVPDVADGSEEAAVGWKKVLPAPNPTFAAFVPPTVIMVVSSLPLITSLPLLSSHAATCALP